MGTLTSVAKMFWKVAGRLPADHLWYLARRMRDEKPHRFAGKVRINSFFPPFPSLAFDRFCDAVVARKRVPYSVYFAVTGRCPFTCPHCSHGGRRPAELSSAEASKLVVDIKALGACNLGLTGGEPLLRADLEELVAAAAPELNTILFTTGAGLDSRRARRLAEAGLGCVTVGMESADPKAHDAVRGSSGSFEAAQAAVAACREAGLYVALSTIATRERITSGELERLRQCAARWGALELRVLSPVATGALAGSAEAMLSPKERSELRAFHVASNSLPGPAVACFAHLESDELFGCGAGFHHLFVDSGGEVCPCDLTPLSFGNVLEEPLTDLWARMGDLFPLPRRGCLMAQVATKIERGVTLPVRRPASLALVPPRDSSQPLPEGYRRLFR